MLDYRVTTLMKVAETLNYTKAAKALHISQPAVSQHIHYLEEEFGCPLVTFDGKKCHLTVNGHELLDMLYSMHNDIQHFKLRTAQETPPLNFGATLTIGEYVMPHILTRLLSRNQNLKINMTVGNTQKILAGIDKGQLDFGIIEGFFSKEKYDYLTFKKEDFIGIASPKSTLAYQAYTYEQLLKETLIVREKGSGTREILDIALKKKHINLDDFHQLVEIGNLNTIKQLVKENLGISFIYRSAVQKELFSGELIKITMKEEPISHDFTFIWPKDSHYHDDYKTIFSSFIDKT